MNELDLVRDLLPEPPGPPDRTAAAALARLEDDIAGRPGPRIRTKQRVRRGWVGGFGLAAVSAAAALAVVVSSTGGPAAPREPVTKAPAVAPMSAREILLTAARQVGRQPDTVRAYWHTADVSRLYYRAKARTGDYTVVWTRRYESWLPSDPQGRSCGWSQDMGFRPAGPADVEAWRRAGSPATFEIPSPAGIPKGKNVKVLGATRPLGLNPPPARRYTHCEKLRSDGTIFSLGDNVTLRDLRALPDDPVKLKALLVRRFGEAGADTERLTEVKTGDSWLFSVARGIILGMPVTSRVRAAAFQMIADLPTVRSLGMVRDANGRTGNAVAIDERTSGGVLQHRLIIDRRTGQALAYEKVILKPAGENAGRPAGSLEISAATLTAEWTDARPSVS